MGRTAIVDLDGVVWRGGRPLPRVGEAISLLRDAGYQVAFFTNNAYLTKADLKSRLNKAGIEEALVLGSADAVASLVEPGERVLVLGGAGLREALEEKGAALVDEEKADAVVVGLDFHMCYPDLARVCKALLGGARFIATNQDPTYPLEDGSLVPGTGAIVAAIKAATGKEPEVAGKPNWPAVQVAKERLGKVDVVIGDRPATDGAFARALSASFVLVLSGVTAEPKGEELFAQDLYGAAELLLNT